MGTGTVVEEPVKSSQFANYWGTDETHRFDLPDGVQWFEFKIMDEGAKTRFQKLTNQDLTISRDNTAKVRVDPAEERHTLIKESVVDWLLYMPKKGEESKPDPEMEKATFSKAMLGNWLQVAPPKVVEDLEYAIRMANPWMQADMKADEIEKEIDRLTERLREAREREAGESVSASK